MEKVFINRTNSSKEKCRNQRSELHIFCSVTTGYFSLFGRYICAYANDKSRK